MTYGQFLLIFLIPPIILFGALAWRMTSARQRGYVLALAAVAFAYTPVWDNYLVANNIWSYDPDLVLGITLGTVPLEEYAFFILQPVAVGLWLLVLNARWPRRAAQPNPAIRRVSVIVLGALWIASAAALVADWPRLTYLALILVWALPPIALQLGFGADLLWQRRGFVLTAITTGTLYLASVDALAIHLGIWTIAPATSLEVYLFGVLPVEELIFFAITNILVVCGITLLLDEASFARLRASLPGARSVQKKYDSDSTAYTA
jgi:lycopene cyclase domain-containing protein